MASTSVKDYILYYKNKLDRCKDNEDMILETIHKLAKPTVTAEVIQDTGILKYLHKLCKRKGRVADTALPLFNKWKLLLSIAMREKDNLKKSSPAEGKPNNASTIIKPQGREGDQPARGNHTASEKDPASHTSHRSRDSHPERGQKRKDPFPPEAEAKRPSHRDRDSKHHTPQKDHPQPDTKTPRSANPSHRSSDSDSDRGSRHQLAKENFASDVDSTKDAALGYPKNLNPMRDMIPPEINPPRRGRSSEFKSRKELFAPDTDSTYNDSLPNHGSTKYQFPQRDLCASETDGACNAETNKDSDSKYPAPKKDYFAADADATRPNSRSSEHNGVSNSQDSNNHIDIDSLSNPNLSIETTQTEKLNCSDDTEHASPTKRTKTLEPYYIEMREGMFRAVKNHASPFSGSGLKVCELIHREIIKGTSTYKRERVKIEDQKSDDVSLSFTMSPRENSGDGEKWRAKNGPSEQKPNIEKSGRASSSAAASKHDLKRKSASPSKGFDKKMCPDSIFDPKLKIKIEVISPSPVSKPFNNVEAHQSNCDRNRNPKMLDSPETSAMQYISSKKERRAVYSGRKSVQDISSLKSICLRVLRKNLDYLRCPVTVPYDTLYPILETLNPSQLSRIEEHNRHLSAYTNSLWKQLYHREHRSQVVGRNEKDILWKEEYNRATEQQRKKLKNLTASISAAASKAKPDRQAKVVESHHDFGRRCSRPPEVLISSSKAPSASPAISSRSSSSPTPKAGSSMPKILLPAISKPKETKHSVTHKPVKKVVAPLMSKVKKSMAIVYRQK